jgi:hypothetical protein
LYPPFNTFTLPKPLSINANAARALVSSLGQPQ